MKNELKRFAKSTTAFEFYNHIKNLKVLSDWERTPLPRKGPLPHLMKQFTVKDYANKFGCSTFIETGTFQGEMVKACADSFSKLYSVELNERFYKNAVNRFRKNPHIKIVQGDSGEKIADILTQVNERCVFWLDGHYSAGETAKGDLETPVASEIEHIFNHHIRDHVILIDDARCFTGEHDYPKLTEFVDELKRRRADLRVEVYNDIIRITPDTPVLHGYNRL